MKNIFKFLLLTIINLANCEYYSAIAELEKLLHHEKFLFENLENYMKAEIHKNLYLKNFLDYAEHEVNTVKNITFFDIYGGPVYEWKALRRLWRNWRGYAEVTLNKINENEYEKRVSLGENTSSFTKPTWEDLKGAAEGISRLQRTYQLKTSLLADGIIMEQKVSSNKLTSSDCYELGYSLLVQQDYKNAISWLTEAHTRRTIELSDDVTARNLLVPSEGGILKELVPALLITGNTKFAYFLAKKHLAIAPNDLQAQTNFQNAEKRIQQQRLEMENGIFREIESKSDIITELYEKTCRGDLQQTPKERRNLRCRYDCTSKAYCGIGPFKMEELSLDPKIVVFYDAIYDSEITNILGASSENLRRSTIGGVSGYGVSNIRTSKNAWLYHNQHTFLRNLGYRLNYITGLSLESAEALQVANYGIGGQYEPHHDFFMERDLASDGNRVLTALFYINDVEMGGATAFPYLKLAVQPVKKSLVVWYNLHRSLEPDYRTKHAGCPVIKGSKWICNEWYHTVGQEFRRPCGLVADGYKSINFSDENMRNRHAKFF